MPELCRFLGIVIYIVEDPALGVNDMLEICSAEYVEGYTIRVTFSDGESGLVDLSEALWGPMFEPLKDQDAFRKVKVSEVLHTICWENDADLSPEYVHDRMVEQGRAQGLAPPVLPPASDANVGLRYDVA